MGAVGLRVAGQTCSRCCCASEESGPVSRWKGGSTVDTARLGVEESCSDPDLHSASRSVSERDDSPAIHDCGTGSGIRLRDILLVIGHTTLADYPLIPTRAQFALTGPPVPAAACALKRLRPERLHLRGACCGSGGGLIGQGTK